MKRGYAASAGQVARLITRLMAALLLSGAALVGPARGGQAQGIRIGLEAGRVTLEARQASVGQVLEALARRADFRMTVVGELEASPGDWSLQDVPLELALSQLVRPYGDLALSFHGAPSQGAPTRPIDALYVFAKSAPPRMPAAPTEVPLPAPTSVEQRGQALLERILASGEMPQAGMAARLQAVREVSALPGAQALRRLGAALSAPEPELRVEIVGALGRLRGDPALLLLGQTLIGDAAPEVRLAAAEALAALEDERAWQFLRQTLSPSAQEPDEGVRRGITALLRGRE